MSAAGRSDTPRQIVIFGAGQAAVTATRYFHADTAHRVVGYAVDAEFLEARDLLGSPVVAVEEVLQRFPPDQVFAFVPMGAARMNQVRTEKYALMKSLGYRFLSYVHSSNDVYNKGSVGENCFILERQTTNYDCAIGDNVVMWSGCHIGDGSRIGDNCFFGSHVVVNGFVDVGAGSYLSSNCTLAHGIKLGARSFIGANALIASDTAEGAVHVVEPTPAMGIDSKRFVKLLRHDI
ncbi:acetyltransferase [Bradyrhizobium sp. 1]|uniref:acetyltransferase n=1 Tax=Bradyrhizobium sp. 1 TaxID=241591 RepID=UPI001FF85F4F|nr:acetyltransferase [Bradyrhizobium sp. 1]MCK1393560.1 acetyltransferase [Bradyrhizobium sp. 1]